MWISLGTMPRCMHNCEVQLSETKQRSVSCSECGRVWNDLDANWWQQRYQHTYTGEVSAVHLCETTGKGFGGKGNWIARKYLAELSGGKRVILDSVSSMLEKGLGFGDSMIAWSVKENSFDFLVQAAFGLVGHDHVETLEAIRRELLWHNGQNRERSAMDIDFGRLAEAISDRYNLDVVQFKFSALGKMLEAAKGARFRSRDIAAELGTRAHELIDLYLKGKGSFEHVIDGQQYTVDLTQERLEVQQCLSAFFRFCDEMELDFTTTESEQTVCDIHLGVGGTLDGMVRTRSGKKILLDWKTSKAVRDKNLIQVAAYARMTDVMTDELPDAAYIVRMDKFTAALQVVPVFTTYSEYVELWKQWVRVVRNARWLKWASSHIQKHGVNEEAA